jgi:hypothetical protein
VEVDDCEYTLLEKKIIGESHREDSSFSVFLSAIYCGIDCSPY